MTTMAARVLVTSIIASVLAPVVALGQPATNPPAPKQPAAPPPAAAGPDLCTKAGAEWSKGIVTQYPWKVISSRNGFEVKYCIVREVSMNRDQAIVRFTNVAPAPLSIKVRTFFALSSGRQVERSAMVARVKPREYVSQILTHAQTTPGEHVKEIGFRDMQVSDKELK